MDFPTTRVTMQGGLVSSALFNGVVYNVIRTWLVVTVEDQRVSHDGLGDTGRWCLGVFYANDGMVVSRDPNCLQHAMNVLVCLFRMYGLAANLSKSHTMTCQPGILRPGMLEEAKTLKCTGVENLYPVILRRRILCPECGVELTAGSMVAYHHRMHGTEPAINWSWLPVSQTEHQTQVYNLSFLRSTKRFPCPFPRCLGISNTWNVLCLHFNRQNWGDCIRIL